MRYFISLLLLLPLLNLSAEEKTGSLSQWTTEELSKYPETVNGIEVFYPSLDENGKLAVSDLLDIPGKTGESIFIGALEYIYDNLDPELESIESIDYDSHRFIMARKMKQGSGKTSTSFEYILAVQVADGILSFGCYDISAEYREKGILPRKLDIEKLKPQENERHKELFIEYSHLNSKFLRNLAIYISQNKIDSVSHWDAIKSKKVVKGMNKTEVKLVYGRPISERTTGKRVKWMYADNAVVIFTNDVVSTVID